MKTMAEVLAEHRLDRRVQLVTMVEYWCICGKTFTNHESHQAAALAAAGYGPVKEVRMAWHDAISAAYVDGALSGEVADLLWKANPYRAATKDAEP